MGNRRLPNSTRNICQTSAGSQLLREAPLAMARHSKKDGITSKCGMRCGASLRKIVKKHEIQLWARFARAFFCGKTAVKRAVGGIWQCTAKSCNRTMAGGCWTLTMGDVATARSAINRPRARRRSEERGRYHWLRCATHGEAL